MQIEREGTRDHPISSLLRMVKVKLHVVIGLDLSHPPSTKRDDARQFMKFLLSDLGIGIWLACIEYANFMVKHTRHWRSSRQLIETKMSGIHCKALGVLFKHALFGSSS
ncbi:unnamed protein product [Brassica rapa]|uniref:Uncharacterized protein n=1 Tax=Brassica campestris TaxID=3711 RepID=A0A8D9H8W7_BRACM|nr:unnamed protein product [Brassica rapa]